MWYTGWFCKKSPKSLEWFPNSNQKNRMGGGGGGGGGIGADLSLILSEIHGVYKILTKKYSAIEENS